MAEKSGYQLRLQARKLWEASQQQQPQPQYTVKEDDTLDQIAATNGLTTEQLLKNNPQMSQLRPGTILDVRNRRIEGVQIGGIGVPSAGPVGAAMGGLASGTDNIRGKQQPGPQYVPPGLGGLTPTAAPQFAPQQPVLGPQYRPAGLGNPSSPKSLGALYVPPGLGNPTAPIGQPHQEIRPGQTGLASPPPSVQAQQAQDTAAYQRMLAARQASYGNWAQGLVAQFKAGTLQEGSKEWNLLVQNGIIQQSGGGGTGAGGGYGGRHRRGGGGRAGAPSGGGGGYINQPQGFSSGTAYRGLVNWRV